VSRTILTPGELDVEPVDFSHGRFGYPGVHTGKEPTQNPKTVSVKWTGLGCHLRKEGYANSMGLNSVHPGKQAPSKDRIKPRLNPPRKCLTTFEHILTIGGPHFKPTKKVTRDLFNLQVGGYLVIKSSRGKSRP